MTEIKVNNEPQKAHNGNNMPWRQEFDPFADLFGFPVIPIPARRGAKPARAMEGFRRAKDGSYILHAEVTGMKAENLDVEFQNGGISVKGKTSGEEDGESYSNQVEYFFSLPEEADPEQIQAKLEDGVLTFKVPVKAGNAPRKIAIG